MLRCINRLVEPTSGTVVFNGMDVTAANDDELRRVRRQIGPVAAFKTAIVVPRLPKTRSGKILRGTMKKIADGQAYTLPATIDDPAILAEITDALAQNGYARKG